MKPEEITQFVWKQAEVVTHPKSRAYFSHLAVRHLSEMKLLLGGGRLNKRDEWDNVYRHCLLQIEVMDIVCDMLRISGDKKEKLLKVAGTHDWKKRIDITKENTADDPEWSKKIKTYLAKVNPDESLMSATGPSFIERGLRGESTELEEIAFYVDDIVAEDMIVPALDRLYLNKLKPGVQKLDDDKELTKRLGGLRYSDGEIKLVDTVERRLAARVEDNLNISLDSHESLPTLILAELNRRMDLFSESTS